MSTTEQEEESTYEISTLNKITRMPNRAKYDHESVHAIFRSAPIAHVAFTSPLTQQPICIPMIAVLDSPSDRLAARKNQSSSSIRSEAKEQNEDEDADEDGETYVYLHGHGKAGTMMGLEEEGERVCVTATSVDGLVLSLTPFHHSMNYRSAVLHCVVVPFTGGWDDEKGRRERIEALKLLTSHLISPLRWEVTREPTEQDYKTTGVIRLRVESGSGKERSGGPKDEKKDLTNQSLTSTCWSGHVPLRLVAGEPVPGEACKESDFPDGATEDVKELMRKWT